MDDDLRRRRDEAYERLRRQGRRIGPLTRLRVRRNLRRLVPAGGFLRPGGEGPEGGTAGVREPRRPLPRSPQGAAERPFD
jgi:hypothetical protein